MKIKLGLKFKMITMFLVCIYISMVLSGIIMRSFVKGNVDYTSRISNVNIKFIKELKKVSNKSNEINKVIEKYEKKYKENNLKIYIINNKEKILYKGSTSNEKSIDLEPLIDKQITLQDEIRYDGNGKGVYYSRISAVKVNNEVVNVLVKGNINPIKVDHFIDRHSGDIGSLLMIIIFIIIISIFIRPKLKYIKEICHGLNEVAKGNLKYRIREKGKDELQLIAFNINNMSEELERKIKNERKIEKSKQDLITNVAHDLRTPLTNIIGYVEIIKERGYKNKNELLKYIGIISNKSESLRKLTNDLFIYTKLSSGSITLNITRFSINELIEQVIDEYIDLFENNNLKLKEDLIDENIIINGDADKIARLFNNLFTNAIKYSIKPSDVNLKLIKEGEKVIISISNKCNSLEGEDINNLFERFYIADKSRSKDKNSSGLGLAISKTIAELHKGKLSADYKNGVITFVLEMKI
ncbi:HAMP domain-containing sensor histidine kinase [Clostridium oceanicum]|uniref:histidine kinase n=1 Tax=Clostridium oceanicum TaxID=1543 RepID=A0ABP3V249_9CLOT